MCFVVGDEVWLQVVHAGAFELVFDACDFGEVGVFFVWFVEDVVLFVFHVDASEAIFEVFAVGAKLTVAAVITMVTEIAVVAAWRVHALV